MARLRASLLAALFSLALVSAQPAGSSVVCRTTFKVFFFFTATHTWISHSQPCLAPSCQYSGPAAWPNVGFEANNRLPVGPGGLRNETYSCSDPSPSSQVTTSCARAAIQLLDKQGWNGGWSSPYIITAGAKNCAGVNAAGACSPSRTGNVWYMALALSTSPSRLRRLSWSFTCAFQDCAVFKLAQTACPERARNAALIASRPPSAWKCPASRWADSKQCDCLCGEWDPDCWDQTLPTGGCKGDDLCTFPGVCSDRNRTVTDRKLLHHLEDGEDVWDQGYVPKFAHYPQDVAHAVPAEWACPLEYYASNDGCDGPELAQWVPGFQGCGPVADPDCKQSKWKAFINH